MILDFAENYACDHQDQVQIAHWTLNQATVHPIVTCYPCDKCSQITTESLVFIYDYLKHDKHGVHNFIETSVDHLRIERKHTLEHGILSSDGCSSQHKSMGPFGDTAYAKEDFGITMERSYFAQGMGRFLQMASLQSSSTMRLQPSKLVRPSLIILYSCVNILQRPSPKKAHVSHAAISSGPFLYSLDCHCQR